jgi:hypothetical protein
MVHPEQIAAVLHTFAVPVSAFSNLMPVTTDQHARPDLFSSFFFCLFVVCSLFFSPLYSVARYLPLDFF